ncbi:MAG: glycosyl hydrolase [Terriglobia bacterium]
MKSLSFRMERVQGPRQVDLPTSETMQAIVAARWLGNKKIDGGTLRLVASADSKGSQTWLVPEGEWSLFFFYLEPRSGFDGGKVDLLNPDATKFFFDLTYGEFYRRYGSYFGNTVQIGFSDHEGDYGYRIAWTPQLFQAFEKRHHYDLRKVLPLLVVDGGDFSIKARCDYLSTVTELYSESFWQGLTTAAQGLGLSRTGHAWEETLQFGAALEGSLFAVERGLNPVGVDSLSDSGRQAVSFKVAQSVADFEGRSFLCEHEGIHGIDSYLDLEGIRQATNAIAAWGVDLFVPHAFNYDAAHATFPPDWFNQPYWPYFHHYADYLRRLSYMNSESRHVAPILLYYPMTSLWAHIDPVLSGQVEYKQVYDPEAWDNPTTAINDYYTRLILKLSEHQWDHLIADDAYLEKAVIEGNELVIGSQRFTAIVLPPLSTLRRSSLNKLIEFHQAGGTIFGIRFLPDSSPEAGGNDPVIKEGIVRLFGPAGSRSGLYSENRSQGGGRSYFISYQVETLIDLLDGSLPKDFQVTEGPEDHLFYQHRHKQGQHYYWVVNDSERPRSNRAMFSQTWHS